MVADVTVVGTGIIALCSAIDLADRGLQVRLVGTTHAGNASSAAGGMLAPTIDPVSGAAYDFAIASRDRYASFTASLTDRTGCTIPLDTAGILEVALGDTEVDLLKTSSEQSFEWLSASELAALEPALGAAAGALFHPLDGAVEPAALLDALSIAVAEHELISTVREDCAEIHASERACSVRTDMESRFESDYVVLAAGAWTPLIVGAGTAPSVVQPVRGQMLALSGSPLRHVTCGAGGYLIPRTGNITVAGGTTEHVGFNSETTPQGIDDIRRRAVTLCPALAATPVHSSWSGLRPMTPDLLPILGADPDRPRIIHAYGHSRNGILLAPLTAEAVSDMVTGNTPRYDLSPFRPDRYL